MAGYRKKKLEEQIKRLIGEALIREVKDPRIGFATVYSVSLADDYSHAEVLISVLGDQKQKSKTLDGLKAAKGFLRSFVGKNIQLRHVPEMTFKIDSSIEEGARIIEMIDSVAASDESSEQETDR